MFGVFIGFWVFGMASTVCNPADAKLRSTREPADVEKVSEA